MSGIASIFVRTVERPMHHCVSRERNRLVFVLIGTIPPKMLLRSRYAR
jgi:hypothetical protein